MRRFFVCSITALSALAGAGMGACGSSSSGGAVDASASTSDDAASGETCYNLVALGNVTVTSVDACKVLGSMHPGATVPGQAPAGLIVSPSCDSVCRSLHGDNFCVVEATYLAAYDQANKPANGDGGTEGGASDASTSMEPMCPAALDAGGVSITCYGEMPYQATACPK